MSSTKPTPEPIGNRAGLPKLSARSGTHGSFLESLRRGLADHNRPGLAALQMREGEDFTLGLFDAYAATLDNLSFYAERQANETYLRTTTRRRALRAQVRLIGYELAPPKAASCHLAFEAEAKAGEANLHYAPGLQVRSIPHDGQLPQLFETIEPLVARADWNAMQPLLTWPQILTADSAEASLNKGVLRPAVGDPVLLMKDNVPFATKIGSQNVYLRRVTEVRDGADGRQIVTLRADPPPPPIYTYVGYISYTMTWPQAESVSSSSLIAYLGAQSWSTSSLTSTGWFSGLSGVQMQQAIRALDFSPDAPILPHVLRVRAGFFGSSAPTSVLLGHKRVLEPGKITETDSFNAEFPAAGRVRVYLDREYPGFAIGGGVLIRNTTQEAWVRLLGVETTGVDAYGQSARVTRLELESEGWTPEGTRVAVSSFEIRDSSLFAMPEELALSDLPITDPVGVAAGDLGAHQIELSTPELLLEPGKQLAITGERADLAGVTAAEIRTLAKNEIVRGHSLLSFTIPLAYRYVRGTVRICANVAEATHGETTAELLGDGDATKSFQRFRLKATPLTYVSARNPRGMAPAIEVRVNRVRWHLVENFRDCGPDDLVYLLRGDEDGSTWVVFGDGVQGARLPTGAGNVEAVYRKGGGRAGHVEAGQLSLLVGKPLGLKRVTNPLPTAGGKDGELLDDARRSAPLGVLTLGRAVTLRDYSDFARGFAGIAKARADWTFSGYARPILVTVAGEGGNLLPESGEDMENLRATLLQAGEADVAVHVRNYRPVGFGVSARLFLHPDFMPGDVEDAARAALLAAFSFDARELGEGVSRAQVIAVLQSVAGVRGVGLDALYVGDTPKLQPRIQAAVGQPDLSGKVPVAAELLTIDPARLLLEVVQ